MSEMHIVGTMFLILGILMAVFTVPSESRFAGPGSVFRG